MEYFVIYDLDDNILAYCDSEDEVVIFSGIRKNNLRSRIKSKGFCYYQTGNSYNIIYKFIEV